MAPRPTVTLASSMPRYPIDPAVQITDTNTGISERIAVTGCLSSHQRMSQTKIIENASVTSRSLAIRLMMRFIVEGTPEMITFMPVGVGVWSMSLYISFSRSSKRSMSPLMLASM